MREEPEILAEARTKGDKIHIGDVMSICSRRFVEMGPDMVQLKGRGVFGGDNARDQDGALAVCQSLSASPSMISTANASIAFGQFPGNRVTSADAVKAYVQADLRSLCETWVRLPKETWPASWVERYRRPLIRLIKSLYGHPESGAHWQNHLEEAVRKLGGKTVEGHPSTFFFKQRDQALTVRVDDLLLAGRGESHEMFWQELGKLIEMGLCFLPCQFFSLRGRWGLGEPYPRIIPRAIPPSHTPSHTP